MNVSIVRASFEDMYDSTLKPLTSPAIWQEKLDASNLVMRSMPDLPARMLAQDSDTVLPTGLMQPRPVTTTRRRLIEFPHASECVKCNVLPGEPGPKGRPCVGP